MLVVVSDIQTKIGIGSLVVLTRKCLGEAIGNKDGIHVMIIVECILVVEVSVECNGLVISRTTDVLITTLLIFVILSQTDNSALTIGIAPCWIVSSIGVVI